MVLCPYCKEEIRDDAVKCKHCHSILDDREIEDGIAYLRSGFAKIAAECDALEAKIDASTGVVFKRHVYSVVELLSSNHLTKIESFIGKMKDDLDRWEAANTLSFKLRVLFTENTVTVQNRLDRIIHKIKTREPTVWDTVCELFTHTLRFIADVLFPMVFGTLITRNQPRFITSSK